MEPIDIAALLDEAVELLRRLGVEVRHVPTGGGGGGLCRVKGKAIVFVDLEADVATRLDRCVEALAGLPGASDLFASPSLRERIDEALARQTG